ncbi:MAG: multiheme c-type cytochrome [Gemmatimonadales bacterium]
MRWNPLWLPLTACALLAAPPAAVAQQADQCVACHSRLPGASGGGHGFAAWRGSRHGSAGVGCEACHGGNPAATDREGAHRGVLGSRDTSSSVYFTHVPETCGKCHSAELGYFRSSIHFARLKSDGRGPNCVTCHGSMATTILSPERALRTCSACHSEGGVAPPERAKESAQILALVRSENMLYDVVATSAGSAGARGAAARLRLVAAQRSLDAAAEVWHGFRLDSAAQRLGAAREDISAAWVALGHPAPREGRPGRAAPARRP